MTDGKYCAYLRKSRADEVREKVEDGYDALAHHRSTLNTLAERMGVTIGRWYSDGIKSGEKIEGRDGMQSLLFDVQAGAWDGVLVVEVERLTRGDLIDQGTVLRSFADTSTLIITPHKVYDPSSEADMEYFEFGMFMSRREFKTINKRLIAGREASVREGQYIGQQAPYGYDKARVGGMKTLVPNQDAGHVAFIFEEYSKGESYRRIAHSLDLMGASPKKGAKWNPNSIRNIVNNPVYIGKIRWNTTKQTPYYENGRRRYKTVQSDDPIVVDGLHEPIISQELWDRAKRRTDAAPVRGEYQMRNHYGRILVCAECGKSLTYCDSGNAKEPMLVHLHKGDGCKTKGCRVSTMDAIVAGVLESMAQNLDHCSEGDFQDDSIMAEACEKEAQRCRQVVKDNLGRMERGVLTEEEYLSRKTELEAKAVECEERAESLRRGTAENARKQAMTLRKALGMLRDQNAPAEAKRKLLWAIVDRIEYTNRAPIGKDDIHLEVFIGWREHVSRSSMPGTCSLHVHYANA